MAIRGSGVDCADGGPTSGCVSESGHAAGLPQCASPKRPVVYGIDLSRCMVLEAGHAGTDRGHHNTAFCQADVERLPFRNNVCV